ncbi:hypothetical protein ACIRD2_09380 [Streptomyces sp. NPDC093595]|uniref:hypothetical protein n=1 Tax=Streptomyces sp. NPDC093595 TaxID=3366045 RepID=UPI0037F6C52B
MATREKEKRPSFGMPRSIVLLATPEGWRHSVRTVEGGMLCGRLTEVSKDAHPHEARTAAAAMVGELAQNLHEAGVEVTWDPPREPGTWTGHVILVTGDDKSPTVA